MGACNALALGALATLIACFPANSWAHRSDLRAVVVEGDVLPDGTTLKTLVTACDDLEPYRPCLALGAGGLVAFYGTTGDGIPAIFTQRGVIVENGETLPDGTTLGIDDATGAAGLANSIRGLAFAGLAATDPTTTKNALFTPQGVVVENGETLPDGSTASINFLGGLSIDARARVAFHGLNAVYTQEGLVVEARQVLPDGTEASAISFFGGVANSGLRDRVAFHGFTDNKQAIFTQRGLVAIVGLLPDGSYLQSIDLLGGLAMSPTGEVAFHGRTEGYDGVFSQRGLLARAGKRLRDGSKLEAIRAEGGIAINRRGTVAFHGVTRGKQAVLTQGGVLAKVGDRLRGGGTLEAISAKGGIAIDHLGQVAFHGITGGKPALFIAR
jgi:hypothetical protein